MSSIRLHVVIHSPLRLVLFNWIAYNMAVPNENNTNALLAILMKK
jgi:hypothetical protein